MQSMRLRKMGLRRRCLVLFTVVAALATISVVLLHPDETPSILQRVASRERFKAQLIGPLRADDPLVLQELRDRYLVPPSQKRYQLNEFETYVVHSTNFLWNASHKLFVENRKVPVTGGFFVEAGALDGVFGSNTLDLEVKYNWTGILIEPDRTMFRRLLKINRKTWAVNICLSPQPYPYEAILRKISTSNDHEENFMTLDINLASMTSLVTQDLLDDRVDNGDATFESAQCFPVHSVLLALNVTRITLFSLDVEDVEWPILEQFPFQSVFVDVWMVEHRRVQQEGATRDTVLTGVYDPAFVKWFESRNYKLLTHRESHVVDYVFVHTESPYSKIIV